jgi:hypothetical protein
MRYNHFDMLPDRAFLKVGGKIMPQGGGGKPTQSSQTTTSIPEYARPYVENTLGQAQALTNINDNPYQPYKGQMVAGFTPMQSQGMAAIGDMKPAAQIAMGTDWANKGSAGGIESAPIAYDYGAQGSQAGQTGLQIGTSGGLEYGGRATDLAGANVGIGAAGMGAGMGYGQQAQNPNAVQGYMNPYLQSSLQPQLAEMQRQYGISGTQQQSNATKAGAFGGSREALMASENQRNKNIAMNQTIGQGYNTAYDVANRNMQAGASLGMQGAQSGLAGLQGANQSYATGLQGVNTALAGTAQGMQGAQTGLQGVAGAQAGYGLAIQGANTLNNLANTQYNQEMGIAQAQMGAGAQQQQLQQQGLNTDYNQYQQQLQYPYQQLSFMQGMYAGLPMQNQAQSMYQNPSMVSQVAGLGTAAAGAYGLYKGASKAEGGQIKAGDGLDTLGMYNAMKDYQ